MNKHTTSIVIRLIVVCLCAGLMAGMTGCSGDASNEKADTDFSYTFTDSLGNTIVLNHRPKNVAVLFSSYAEIWTLAGGKVSVTVGDSVARGFAEESAILVNDGAGLKIDIETLVSAEPDFVIVTADLSAQVEAAETLGEMGIPCAQFREESFEDYLTILKICTEITGNTDVYEQCGTTIGEAIDSFLKQADTAEKEPVSYLFIRAGAGSSSTKARTADNHLACAMIDRLGGENIADEIGALSDELSLESILMDQPDIIFVLPQGDIDASRAYIDEVFSTDGWKELTAVQNGRIVYLEKELFGYKPNERWAEAYETLYGYLYPELAAK